MEALAHEAVASSGVLWASIIASVGVATLTTLVIEWFAKPRLEARKDRIVERSKRERSVLHDLERGWQLIRRLHAFRDDALSDTALSERMLRYSAEVERTMDEALEMFGVPEAIEVDWLDTAASDRLAVFIDLFGTARWRLLKKRKLVGKIEAMRGQHLLTRGDVEQPVAE